MVKYQKTIIAKMSSYAEPTIACHRYKHYINNKYRTLPTIRKFSKHKMMKKSN